MKELDLRTLQIAQYLVLNRSTIRKAATAFGLAKSTVHHDLNHRLPYIDDELFFKVRQILNINFKEKNIRGGEATKNMYGSKQKSFN